MLMNEELETMLPIIVAGETITGVTPVMVETLRRSPRKLFQRLADDATEDVSAQAGGWNDYWGDWTNR